MCGVVLCILPNRPSSPIYVTGNFVESSILGDQFQPILCMMNTKTKEFIHVDYIPLKTEQTSSLHVKLVNRDGDEEAPEQEGITFLVLDFQKKT